MVCNVIISASLHCGDHEIMKVKILGESEEGKYQSTDPGL